MGQFRKVRFFRRQAELVDSTAGLVFKQADIDRLGVTGISKCFPAYEANKMHNIEMSPQHSTYDGAFLHVFDDGEARC